MSDTSTTSQIKSIDPCALASITCGILLCESGFGSVMAAAEWVLGYPVWTHEWIDPQIQTAMQTAVLAQFPDMPMTPPVDWRAEVVALHTRYGQSVVVARGTGERDRSPVDTLRALKPDADITVVETAPIYSVEGSTEETDNG